MPSPRLPFKGVSRQLVMSFDIGTTFSGVSYCVLDPGQVPEIQSVTLFPAQAHGNSKVPSLIYYDRGGLIKAAGAEALLHSIKEQAGDENWFKLQWWKLLLAPKDLFASLEKYSPPQLPPNKSIIDLFADFLGYLFRCAKAYILDSYANGGLLWDSVESSIQFVLTHPNGWEGAQQTLLRRAAIRAKFVPDTDDGQSRITFVTEGEASFNYCATNSLSVDAFKENRNILVIDAGGGTIDISAYSITSVSPLSVDELFSPECLMQGSEFVTFRAGDHIRNKLRSSRFNTPQELARMIEHFDQSGKRVFVDQDCSIHVMFGSFRENDPDSGITGGKLKLSGVEVASFYEECIDSVGDIVSGHFRDLIYGNTSFFLVGGFAASPWLFKRLQEEFQHLGLILSRPDGQTNKAVADGAISFYLDHFVSSRIAKFTYGAPCVIEYDKLDPEHRKRSHKIFESCSGEKSLENAFAPIITKGSRVSALQEFSTSMVLESHRAHPTISSAITCYKGRNESPQWTDTEPKMFHKLCHVEADVSGVPKVAHYNSKGQRYFQQAFEIILLFGLTEFKAQLCWFENGEEKRSATKVVYDDEDD